jgi:hypothetical protein
LRRVTWTDARGRQRAALVRDNDPDEVAINGEGIPLDPPDVFELDCEKLMVELHNQLVGRGLITAEDVTRSQNGLSAAVLSALKPALHNLYRGG